MGDQLMEWCALGLLLRQLRPDRFEEIVLALRETVRVEEILAPGWGAIEIDSSLPTKS